MGAGSERAGPAARTLGRLDLMSTLGWLACGRCPGIPRDLGRSRRRPRRTRHRPRSPGRSGGSADARGRRGPVDRGPPGASGRRRRRRGGRPGGARGAARPRRSARVGGRPETAPVDFPAPWASSPIWPERSAASWTSARSSSRNWPRPPGRAPPARSPPRRASPRSGPRGDRRGEARIPERRRDRRPRRPGRAGRTCLRGGRRGRDLGPDRATALRGVARRSRVSCEPSRASRCSGRTS